MIFILALLTDQFKMPSKTFALSRQMEGECWKNGLRDCHAVKVNFVPLIKYPYISYLSLGFLFQLYIGTCARAIQFWARALFI